VSTNERPRRVAAVLLGLILGIPGGIAVASPELANLAAAVLR
jgi:hypothetical protein